MKTLQHMFTVTMLNPLLKVAYHYSCVIIPSGWVLVYIAIFTSVEKQNALTYTNYFRRNSDRILDCCNNDNTYLS